MAEMMKHTGILTNTGKNVVVVFMSLPGDADHALVIDTDALPDQFNDSLRRVVESTDGQNAKDLAEVLARKASPDGSNMSLLEKFHHAGRLQKVTVDNVTMVPRKGINWPLRDVLAAMIQEEGNIPAELNDLDPETRSQVINELGKFNVHTSNLEGTTIEGKAAEARSLLQMAELLEADANTKRQQAYTLDPSLNKRRVVETPNKVISKTDAKAKAASKVELSDTISDAVSKTVTESKKKL